MVVWMEQHKIQTELIYVDIVIRLCCLLQETHLLCCFILSFQQGHVVACEFTMCSKAVLCVRRSEQQKCSWSLRRCTHPARKTRYPCWREEFLSKVFLLGSWRSGEWVRILYAIWEKEAATAVFVFKRCFCNRVWHWWLAYNRTTWHPFQNHAA